MADDPRLVRSHLPGVPLIGRGMKPVEVPEQPKPLPWFKRWGITWMIEGDKTARLEPWILLHWWLRAVIVTAAVAQTLRWFGVNVAVEVRP